MNLRSARDQGQELPPEQQAELNRFVEMKLRAATARTLVLVQQAQIAFTCNQARNFAL